MPLMLLPELTGVPKSSVRLPPKPCNFIQWNYRQFPPEVYNRTRATNSTLLSERYDPPKIFLKFNLCLRLDVGEPVSTGSLLRRRPGHLLQPLRGRGRGGRGSRPLTRFATRQGDGRSSRSSRPSHRSPPAVSLHRHNAELEHRFQRGALNAGRPHYGVLFASIGERSLLTISANDRPISDPFVSCQNR